MRTGLFEMFFLALVLIGCDLVGPEYKPYKEQASGGSEDDSEDDSTVDGDDSGDASCGLSAFTENVAPSITATCDGCHGGGANSFALNADDDENNRDNLYEWSGGDAQTLFTKVSNADSSHPGGDQSAALSLSKISAWLDAEASCQ